MTDMIDTQCPWNIGDEVVGSDDSRLGTVKAYDERVITVEHGLWRKDDLFVPVDAVNNVAEQGLSQRYQRSGDEPRLGRAARGRHRRWRSPR